jgi:hypothetical protein
VAPVVADLLGGPSAKLSDTETDGVGGAVVQGVRDEARAGLHEHLSPAAVAEMDRPGWAVAEGGGPGGRLQGLVDGSGVAVRVLWREGISVIV